MAAIQARLMSITSPEEARQQLTAIGVDPGGIAMMATKMQSRCIKLFDLACRQANILKQEMLSLGGDAAVARGTVACSIPKTDVILIGTDKQLHGLCRKLPTQPFGLADLVPLIQTLLANSILTPRFWQTSQRQISLDRPLIMGILNVTPDSFSDGNRFFDPLSAIERGMQMAEQGADIIDIGGESTRPGAASVSAEEELQRVIPVITALHNAALPCFLSIDTWKSSVASEAVAAGAEIINDISGLTFDPAMASVAAKTAAGIVLMHTRGTPQTMQSNCSYHDLVSEIMQEIGERINAATAAGVERSSIVIDPGICFAKTAEQNLYILKNLAEFNQLGLPILIGTSRKSFIGSTLQRTVDERLFGTAATVALAVSSGARIIRVHDVREMRDVADMAHAITYPDFNSE